MQNQRLPQAPSRVQRGYRALLRLLPFEFRSEFGRDMEDAFLEEHHDVRARRSVAETLTFWARTAKDFARTAPSQHWDILRQDVRGGMRLLTRNPGFAATAILTLALGIGGATSIFSVVYAVVFRPLAFPESERVVRISWGGRPASYIDYEALRDKTTAFDLIAVSRHDSLTSDKGSLRTLVPGTPTVGGVGPSFMISQMVSASFFRIFGATTVLGRLPTETDEQPGAPPVAVISYSTWTSLFGRDPNIVGRTIQRHLDDRQTKIVTIVGVLAPDAISQLSRESSVEAPAWSSLDLDVVKRRGGEGQALPFIQIYGRLAAGTRVEAAQAQLAALTPHLAAALPAAIATNNPTLTAIRLRDQLARESKGPLLAFLGAVTCLLLVAAVNVSSLVLARSMSRRPEFATRMALGARPLRVARQLLTESALLALLGGIAGLAVAWAATRAFIVISPPMPRLQQSAIDGPTLLFALGAVVLAAGIAALVPALQTSRRSVVDGLRRAGGAQTARTAFTRPLALLAGAEVALVLVLLAGTALLVNSFARLFLFDLGIDPRSVTMLTIDKALPPAPTSAVAIKRQPGEQPITALTDRQRVMRAVDTEVIERVSSIPGVVATALTGDDPFGPPYRYGVDIQIGTAGPATEAAIRLSSPAALDALDMRVVAGRWFTPDDRDGTPFAAVVNETMARKFWTDRSPVGDRIIFGHRMLHVVGVVADVKELGARQEVRATFYMSVTQLPVDPTMLVVRSNPEFHGIENTVNAELSRMGARISPHSPRSVEDMWWRQLADARFLTSVLATFSLLALLVALVGVHGVLRFVVVQRSREMGIRKALGATQADIVGLVLRQALYFAVPGCAVGLIGAALAAPALRSMLFGITPGDPLTFGATTALVIAAVLVGAYFPARRASAVDPSLSLRAE